jgi:hypothetical protein
VLHSFILLSALEKGAARVSTPARENFHCTALSFAPLAAPTCVRYRPSRFKKSEKLGDVDEANPEHNDYFVPTPIPSAARKEVYGGVAKSCGVGITFVYDEAQEAVVVQRILKDSPAHRSDQIGATAKPFSERGNGRGAKVLRENLIFMLERGCLCERETRGERKIVKPDTRWRAQRLEIYSLRLTASKSMVSPWTLCIRSSRALRHPHARLPFGGTGGRSLSMSCASMWII